jgi:hypothetical protein
MPQASNIVLADAQGTPVNHTFIPIGREKDGTFLYEDQSASTSAGFWRIGVKTKRPDFSGNVPRGVFETTVSLHEPTLESLGTNDAGLTPPPTVAYTLRAVAVYYDPPRSLLQNRKDIVKMFPLLLSETSNIKPVLESHQELTQ